MCGTYFNNSVTWKLSLYNLYLVYKSYKFGRIFGRAVMYYSRPTKSALIRLFVKSRGSVTLIPFRQDMTLSVCANFYPTPWSGGGQQHQNRHFSRPDKWVNSPQVFKDSLHEGKNKLRTINFVLLNHFLNGQYTPKVLIFPTTVSS